MSVSVAQQSRSVRVAAQGTDPHSRLRDPEWVSFRKRVIAALQRDGTCLYVTADSFAGRCPICDEGLAVRFKGRTPAADFACCGLGCDERHIAAMLGKARHA